MWIMTNCQNILISKKQHHVIAYARKHLILATFAVDPHVCRMHLNRSTLAFIATLTLAALLIGWVISRVTPKSATGNTPTRWQHGDSAPSGDTIRDPWLDLADGWSEAAVPLATEIGPAMRPGDDLQVFAAADGIVLFSGLRDGTHGVILGHRNRDGTRFESIYTPLAESGRKPGELIGRGMLIGRLGQAPLSPVWHETPISVETASQEKSPLAIALESLESDAWMSLEIGNAGKMLELRADPED